ncbi:MAG: hypothetical protein QG608_635 [Actinomycetota bacterium]|nr:hypothetical protein [Actinomycetota bacterium]
MTLIMLCGALGGLGLFLALRSLDPRTDAAISGATALARLDADLHRNRAAIALTADRRHSTESERLRRLGSRARARLDRWGLDLPRDLRADLSLLGRSIETHLALTLAGAAAGFVLPIVLVVLLTLVGGGVPAGSPVWMPVLGAILGTALPSLGISSRAGERRRDFRHVVGSFLDLVSMNLAGGRGIPEALTSASTISDGWAMVRIRDTLETARLQGATPWSALGHLGEETRVDELRDLASALALVADDGAKIRESLAARAASLRRRELADAEGRAQARSQSMLVAQLLLCLGFLVFLIYPAVARVLGS